MPLDEFEPAIPARKIPHTHAFDHAATGIDHERILSLKKETSHCQGCRSFVCVVRIFYVAVFVVYPSYSFSRLTSCQNAFDGKKPPVHCPAHLTISPPLCIHYQKDLLGGHSCDSPRKPLRRQKLREL